MFSLLREILDKCRAAKTRKPLRQRYHRRLRLETLETRRLLTTLTVTSAADSGTGTLRAAITTADNNAGPYTVQFAPDVTSITLDSLLEISNTAGVTIDGPSAGLTLSGGNATAVFQVDGGASLTIEDLTIVDATGGGAISNDGTLTVMASTFSGNSAGRGGAVWNGGTMTVRSTTFSGNSAGEGGAIVNNSTLTVTSSTFSGNSAGGEGGAVWNAGTLTITSSTFSANSVSRSGGIGMGGAIFNAGTLTVTSTTFSANSVSGSMGPGFGGAIDNSSGDAATLDNTIVAGNAASLGADIYGSVTADYCLIQQSRGGYTLSVGSGNNVIGQSANLEPLAFNGGPTETMALLPGSRAIGAGDPGLADRGITTDQRGEPLPSGGGVDIGAFQDQGYTLTVTAGSDQSATVGIAFPNSLVVSFVEGSSNPLQGVTITLTGPASVPAPRSPATASLRPILPARHLRCHGQRRGRRLYSDRKHRLAHANLHAHEHGRHGQPVGLRLPAGDDHSRQRDQPGGEGAGGGQVR